MTPGTALIAFGLLLAAVGCGSGPPPKCDPHSGYPPAPELGAILRDHPLPASAIRDPQHLADLVGACGTTIAQLQRDWCAWIEEQALTQGAP